MNDIFIVELSKRAIKDLKKIPKPIVGKLITWVKYVENEGLREARKIKGYHDEPLQGEREGQRSIRLNKAYRAIYTLRDHNKLEFVLVEEVNKHDY